MDEKEYIKKKTYYENKLNKEVQILKTLLNTENIMYIDINKTVDHINTYKNILSSLEDDYNIHKSVWD